MKKILLISDSHLENEILKNIIDFHSNIDIYIHCGDSCLCYNHPLLNQFIVVRGNHDEDQHLFYNRFLTVENFRILVTHGHLYDVYNTYTKICNEAKQLKCNLIFHGHTHIATSTLIDNIRIINPGSIMFNRGSYGFGTYAIVTIDQEKCYCNFYHHLTHKIVDNIVINDGITTLNQLKNIS